MTPPIDEITLNFNQESLILLNIILGVVMYGISLDLRFADFKAVIKKPKGPIIGLIAQFLLLPAFTFLLTRLIDMQPSIALGMILVAACPGGNVSNFMTHLARGNTALSITMTAVSTTLAIIMTPVNIWFWGTMDPQTKAIYEAVQLDPMRMFIIIFTLLGIPLLLGLLTQKRFPEFARKGSRYFRFGSIVVFALFVVVALYSNFSHFLNYIHLVIILVFIHNASALGLGYGSARSLRMGHRDAKAVSIEVGIQNSALGLILIFNFFDGLGGMALVAAWWGVWHLISGLTMGLYWSRSKATQQQEAETWTRT